VALAAEEIARPAVDWGHRTSDTEAKWTLLKARLDGVQARPWAEQTELRERMRRLNFELARLLGQL
jgi:metallo-beta-lactamase family protein